MSLVVNQVWRLDAYWYLDRLPIPVESSSEDGAVIAESRDPAAAAAAEALDAPRVDNLLRIVRSLSISSSTQPLLATQRIRSLLSESGLLVSAQDQPLHAETDGAALESKSPYETEVEWLLVSKATVQVYGVVLKTLLERIIPLSDDIWYWDDVLSSYAYSSLYTVQTSPLRLWAWSREIHRAARLRLRNLAARDAPVGIFSSTEASVSRRWRRFYDIIQETIRERSLANIQRKILSPVAFSQAEARRKQAQLRRLREITASGLGMLIDEGPHFKQDALTVGALGRRDVKSMVERNVALLDTVLREVCTVETDAHQFEDRVFATVGRETEKALALQAIAKTERPTVLANRLLGIIDHALPQHVETMQSLADASGRPNALVRYWLPVIIGLASSTTILRVLVNRQADIIDWITDLGRTTRDFWIHWVVKPTEKIIKTIRHDEASEIAIMSRDSLRADRESLERMVVDFAIDKPHLAGGGSGSGSTLSAAQIADIRTKVAEGDVTPVLRAYEQDLRSPFVGAVRGDLVRSLLIQVQKTKVDLEVAMTGIDSLLKSQELVFGFVGLTPGVLVSIGIAQYLRGVFGGRSTRRQRSKAGKAVRVLRNMDRILTDAEPVAGVGAAGREVPVLAYKDYGLLVCEVHVLRSMAARLMPRSIEREFLEDLEDLANTKGIEVQRRALERIRWAYGRWLC
ncbi:Nuclear control of ATPase protein 2 [Escovopsis weberi]|uniref:Nuclear control of ATPase protein 2 n=1 Tax=Escovopsis weberi TaxID=150374 RepID=A0A0M9VSY3_ESCWE|nr:Nuclear control of ATPase protein 2 [Escovopsis weberi]